MTAEEAYNLLTKGGAEDFARVMELCEKHAPYCLIGGLAVNCFVEPVYTLDADIVIVAEKKAAFEEALRTAGFAVEVFEHSVNAKFPKSDLRIQCTTDIRYKDFPLRATKKTVFGKQVLVAALPDLVQGKVWAYSDPMRRLTKRKKDELDLLRIGEAYPEIRSSLPIEIQRQLS